MNKKQRRMWREENPLSPSIRQKTPVILPNAASRNCVISLSGDKIFLRAVQSGKSFPLSEQLLSQGQVDSGLRRKTM